MTTPDTLPATQSGMAEGDRFKRLNKHLQDTYAPTDSWRYAMDDIAALQARISQVEKNSRQHEQDLRANFSEELSRVNARAEAAEARVRQLETEVRKYDPRWMLAEWQAMKERGEVSDQEAPFAEKILTIQNEKWPSAAAPLLTWVESLQLRWDRSVAKREKAEEQS